MNDAKWTGLEFQGLNMSLLHWLFKFTTILVYTTRSTTSTFSRNQYLSVNVSSVCVSVNYVYLLYWLERLMTDTWWVFTWTLGKDISSRNVEQWNSFAILWNLSMRTHESWANREKQFSVAHWCLLFILSENASNVKFQRSSMYVCECQTTAIFSCEIIK